MRVGDTFTCRLPYPTRASVWARRLTFGLWRPRWTAERDVEFTVIETTTYRDDLAERVVRVWV